ncbi:MAG: SufD family Fe-S cluster assembly protein [Candidatus Heimdallarchaeota archaeon]|nr:SufD family Fe-S cluster assembly protein [Candidatus Heimdallarchaeota archaeon]MDH5645746.1 SufD family Fe-S cluster assembly protein [Candidatus Heimdallarchaeota archaeon]
MSTLKLFETEYTTKEKITTLSDNKNEVSWIKNRRMQAFDEFKSLNYDKDNLFHKYTDFRKFNPKNLMLSTDGDEIYEKDLSDLKPSLIETENGLKSMLSPELIEKGVFFGDINDFIKLDETMAKQIIDEVSFSENFDKLGSLSRAFAKSIILLYMPKNVIIDEPLVKLSMLKSKEIAHYSEFIIYLSEGSQINLIELFENFEPNESEQLYSGIQSIFVGENASLKVMQIQNWSKKTVHISAKFAKLNRYGKYKSAIQQQGGDITRYNSNVDLYGQGSEGYDLFISFGNNSQRYDVKSELHHNARDTIGQTHARQVMMDKSESVLRGMIVIAKPGVNADSWLTSQGMTIGKGKVIAIPALKIDQNDVKAAHAASVEPLDESQLFYLQSRGIPLTQSKEMLIKGYFEYIFKTIENSKMSDVAREYLSHKWDVVSQ